MESDITKKLTFSFVVGTKMSKDESYRDLIKEHRSKIIDMQLINIYVKFAVSLMELNGRALELLGYCIYVARNNGAVYNNRDFKRSLDEELLLLGKTKMPEQSVQKGFRELVENGIMSNNDRGIYILNPEFIIKGGYHNRIKKLQMEFEISNKNEYEELNGEIHLDYTRQIKKFNAAD